MSEVPTYRRDLGQLENVAAGGEEQTDDRMPQFVDAQVLGDASA
ncbi:MAG: hypothetical protein JWO36_6692 [Myxococcales bacterium]|nr:hypothetical protein [Myxococcales bacterium]